MIRLLSKINSFLAIIGSLLLILTMLSISYSVITRFLHLSSPIWIVQVNEYAMVWICFLATAWVLSNNRHVTVEILISRFSKKGKKYFRLLQDTIGTILCGALCYLGTLTVLDFYSKNVVDVQSIDVPKAWIVIVIPFGFLLLTFQFLQRTFEDLH